MPASRCPSTRPTPGPCLPEDEAEHTLTEEPPQPNWGPGFHVAAGQRVDAAAYERYTGRWSRLFVPDTLAETEVGAGDRLLDVAAGTGVAVTAALALVGPRGLVVGVDISAAMLEPAVVAFTGRRFRGAVMDGQSLAFSDACFDGVICHLGLMFFPDPLPGLTEFRRVLRPGRRAAVCVISTPDRAPVWGPLAEALSRQLPDVRSQLHLSFVLADPQRLERLFATARARRARSSGVRWRRRYASSRPVSA